MADQDWLQQLKDQFPQMAGLLGSLEPSAKDKHDALTSGLLAAGAQILANAGGGRTPPNPIGAIGTGLFGGLQNYQGNLDSQRKDAIQRMQGLSGLLSMGSQLQGMDDLKQFKMLMGIGSPTAATSSDFAPGENPAPFDGATSTLPQSAAPQSAGGMYGIPREVVAGALSRNPQVNTLAKMIEDRIKPQNLTAGATVGGYDKFGNFVPSYTAPRLPESARVNASGSIEMYPGAEGAIQAAAGAQAQGAEAAKANVANTNEIIEIPAGNGSTMKVTRGQALAFANNPRLKAWTDRAFGQMDVPQPPSPQAPGNSVGMPAPGAASQGPAPDIVSAMQWIQKSGTPVSWQPDTGLLIGDAATAYRQKMQAQQAQQQSQQGAPGQPPQGPQGDPPQQQPSMAPQPVQNQPPAPQPAPPPQPTQMPPGPPQGAPMPPLQPQPAPTQGPPMTAPPPDIMAAREAAARQAATMPGDVLKSTAEELGKSDVAAHAGAMTDAKAAFQGNQMIDKTRGLIQSKEGIYGGALAPGIMGTAAFINGLGIPFDASRFTNSKEADKYMEGMALSLVKSYVGSTQISDRDVAAVKATMTRINDDPTARLRLLDTLQGINDRKIDLFSRMDSYIGQKGSLRGFDYGLKPSDPGGDALKQPNSPPPAPDAKWQNGAWMIERNIGGRPKQFKWVP